MGWSNKRFSEFKQTVTNYRREPTPENYLLVRRRFPDVEIQVSHFAGIDPLYALEHELKKQGVDPDLVGAALDGDEPSIDALSLRLLECLVSRSKLPKSGPGYIDRRREAISDATVNYLIATMLETFDWHEEMRHVPPSLIVLARHQLSGLNPDLHKLYLSHEKRMDAARIVAQHLAARQKLSISQLAIMLEIPRSTVGRWLRDDEFKASVKSFERLHSIASH